VKYWEMTADITGKIAVEIELDPGKEGKTGVVEKLDRRGTPP
jgi:hypothetical protein